MTLRVILGFFAIHAKDGITTCTLDKVKNETRYWLAKGANGQLCLEVEETRIILTQKAYVGVGQAHGMYKWSYHPYFSFSNAKKPQRVNGSRCFQATDASSLATYPSTLTDITKKMKIADNQAAQMFYIEAEKYVGKRHNNVRNLSVNVTTAQLRQDFIEIKE